MLTSHGVESRKGNPAPVRDDPELGPVRYCRRCEEWWPFDDEFWFIYPRDGYRPMVYCRACQSERAHERTMR